MLAVPPPPWSGRVVCEAEVCTEGTTAAAVAVVSAVTTAAPATARRGRRPRLGRAADALLVTSRVRVGFPAVRTGGLPGSGLRAAGPVERECRKDRPIKLDVGLLPDEAG
jgi:hypothetical protein